ncbi:MAG TPA: imidazole glycerol phosphate synthase subunit HisH [Dongiaceae bacterium]|nr:imidazole glycerol phosphate synthase subunit HisH [Dongiaceae bacterium]
MSTVVIDYGSGNLRSAAKALAAAGGDVLVTSDPRDVAKAKRIVLPGVGAFADCRAGLDGLQDMVATLDEAVRQKGRPFLGICVGMQLMAEAGLEHGRHPGLGWIAGDVINLSPRPNLASRPDLASRQDPALKIPHMGWNELRLGRVHPLFAGIEDGAHAYFVHSYHLALTNPGDLLAATDYGGPVVAAIARDNMLGVQFHPEKSQAMGLRLLANFLNWQP